MESMDKSAVAVTEDSAAFILPVLRMNGDQLAELNVIPSQKISEVKRELEGRSQTPAPYQRLLLEGRILGKNRTLGEEGVCPGSTLILVREPVEVTEIDKVTRWICRVTCEGHIDHLDEDCRGSPKTIMAFLLEQGADPNTTDFFGLTPLHIAVRESNLGVVEALLAHGSTKVDWRAIELALYAKMPNLRICEVIVQDARFKPLINSQDSDGNTALMIALRREYYMHQDGPSPQWPHISATKDPLQYVGPTEDPLWSLTGVWPPRVTGVWQTILAGKADVNLTNRKNKSALAIAMKYRNTRAVETLKKVCVPEAAAELDAEAQAIAQAQGEAQAEAQAIAEAIAKAQAKKRQAFQQGFQSSFFADQSPSSTGYYAAQSPISTGYYAVPGVCDSYGIAMRAPAETEVSWASGTYGVLMGASSAGAAYGIQMGVPMEAHVPWVSGASGDLVVYSEYHDGALYFPPF